MNTPSQAYTPSIKSKYEGSSKKIKQLYDEFQQLKRRISTPVKNRKQAIYSLHHNIESVQSVQLKPGSFSYNYPPKRTEYDTGAKTMADHEMRIFLKSSFQKYMNINMNRMQKDVDESVSNLQERLVSLGKVLEQVNRFFKLKCSNMKSMKCNCKWKGSELKQIQSKYNQKIQQLKSNYESKISLLVKENETSGSSNYRNNFKEAEEQLKLMQQKILMKQGEIISQQKQITRLRRMNDQKENHLYEKQNIINDLIKQTKEKNSELVKHKHQIEKMKKHIEERGIQIDKKQQFEEKIREEIEQLQEKNLQLQAEVRKLKSELCNMTSPRNIRNTQRSKGQEWEFSQIDIQEEVHSDFEEEEIIGNSLKIDEKDFSTPLRHSHFIQTNTKKKYYQLEAQLKELEAEVQLLSEENKLLKSKKDRFEEQVKENQSDQEKFQMQSQILRDQLKRINGALKNLDECAVIYLKNGKLGPENINALDSGLQFKSAYLKKYPMRSASLKKK